MNSTPTTPPPPAQVALTNAINSVRQIVETITVVIIVILGALALIYAVWMAFKLARAEDDGKRKEAKNHMFWAIAGVIVAVAMFIILDQVLRTLAGPNRVAINSTDALGRTATLTVNLIRSAVTTLLNFAAVAGLLFAIYIGVRMVTASDDSKRKQAKQQIIWTFVAILGIFLFVAVVDIAMVEMMRGQPGVTIS